MKRLIAIVAACAFVPVVAFAQNPQATTRQDTTKKMADSAKSPNQTKSGVTNTKTGKSTLGPDIKHVRPTGVKGEVNASDTGQKAVTTSSTGAVENVAGNVPQRAIQEQSDPKLIGSPAWWRTHKTADGKP